MLSRRAFTGLLLGSGVMPSRLLGQEDQEYLWQWDVLFGTDREMAAALQAIGARGSPDLAAGLIVALRYNRDRTEVISDTLAALTGESGAKDWFGWMLWQEQHPEVVPHPSFIDFHRDIMLRIDPNFDVLLRRDYLQRDRMKIRLEEIAWGGVVKDGIPSLDNPRMVAAGAADYMRDDDLVFGVAINGDVRAYPLRIMGWHEMFNEVIGGVPVALAYCTLCGSGILYETRVPGRARPFVFGSSGFLYRSNKLMFDRETHSLWNQFTGRPVVGPLVDSGIELVQRPVVIARWDEWRRDHPGTRILSLDTGFRRDYGSGVVYQDYFASPDLMFPTVTDQSRQKQKDYVFGIRRFGGAKAWPVEAFRKQRLINDSVAGLNVVLIGDAEARTVRAYERGERQFRLAGGRMTSDDGMVWMLTEDALTSDAGDALPRVAGHVAFWFAWDGYLGDQSELYTE